jgi:3-oxoacyl-[acyl-carrier protein] reductase
MRGETLRLLDKIAIVTGGGSGVGKAISQLYAGEGATVVVSDIDLEAAKRLMEEIKGLGGKALAVQTDVTRGEEVEGLVEDTTRRFGRLDIMVNNAGVNSPVSWKEMTKGEWDRVMDINLWGVFAGCRAAGLAMMKQKSGKIINLSSLVAKTGSIFSGMNYSASKAGVSCLTINFAKLLAPHGINVNAIAPGPLDTAFHKTTTKEQREAIVKSFPLPLGAFGEAKDAAEVALFLASDAARIITGEIIDVNGGMFMD